MCYLPRNGCVFLQCLRECARRAFAIVGAIVILTEGQTSSLHALDIHWNGGFSQFWHNEFNWDLAGGPVFFVRRVPGDTDTATLLTPAGDDVYLGGNTAPINGITIGNGIDFYTNGFLLQVDNAGTGFTAVAGGADLHIAPRVGNVQAFETDNLLVTGHGNVIVEGGNAFVQGTTTLTANGDVFGSIGGNIHFGGDVNMYDHSVLRLLNNATASFAAGATISADDVSIIDLEFELSVINDMAFEIMNGARMEVTALNIGNNGFGIGSVGSILLDDQGSPNSTSLDVDEELTIGHSTTGSGLLHLKGAVVFALGTTTIRPTGTLQLEGGAQFAADDTLTVDGGTITATGIDTPIFLYEGVTLSAINGGSVTIDGDEEIRADGTFDFASGSSLTVTEDLIVGAPPFGIGTVNVAGCMTTIEVGDSLTIGTEGSPGEVTLSEGAEGNVFQARVGATGMGELTIESGATLTSDYGFIANSNLPNPGSGTVTIDGSGSKWTVNVNFDVGRTGPAQLNIQNGGEMTIAEEVRFALNNAGNGTAVVGGGGARWSIGTNMWMGGGPGGASTGSGTLTIQPGGFVEVGDTITLFNNGEVNLSGGTLTTHTFDFLGGDFNWTSGVLHVEIYPTDLENTGGVLAPGESAGSTSINGDYSQFAAAVLEIEIGGELSGVEFDHVFVDGVADIDGQLHLGMLDGFAPDSSDVFSVFAASAGISGLFSNVANGARLDTFDGVGSFLVHYGAGSAFNSDEIVLSDFLLTYSADFDHDGDVDGDDLVVWQNSFGPGGGADADGDGDSDGDDFLAWQQQFGSGVPALGDSQAVPEPTGMLLFLSGCCGLVHFCARTPR